MRFSFTHLLQLIDMRLFSHGNGVCWTIYLGLSEQTESLSVL